MCFYTPLSDGEMTSLSVWVCVWDSDKASERRATELQILSQMISEGTSDSKQSGAPQKGPVGVSPSQSAHNISGAATSPSLPFLPSLRGALWKRLMEIEAAKHEPGKTNVYRGWSGNYHRRSCRRRLIKRSSSSRNVKMRRREKQRLVGCN